MLHCLNLLPSPQESALLFSKVSTGGPLLDRTEMGFPCSGNNKEDSRSSLSARSARVPVGTELAWKEQGLNKAPQEAMQSSHIFHGFCSTACNQDILSFKIMCFSAPVYQLP